MEDPPEPVAAEVAHHREALVLSEGLDRMADVADGGARAHHLDATHHRLVGDVDQLAGLERDAVADREHPAGIAMPAAQDGGDVDVDDVAVLEALVARDAVAHHVVDRGADRFREAAIAQRCRYRLAPDDELVAQPVELAGRDPGHDVRGDEVERLGGQAAGLVHVGEGLGAVELDHPGIGPLVGGTLEHVHEASIQAGASGGPWAQRATIAYRTPRAGLRGNGGGPPAAQGPD